jgi:hypothetical protein
VEAYRQGCILATELILAKARFLFFTIIIIKRHKL